MDLQPGGDHASARSESSRHSPMRVLMPPAGGRVTEVIPAPLKAKTPEDWCSN